MSFEISIIRALQSIRSNALDTFFEIVSYLGSLWAVLVVAVLIFFLFNKKVGVAFLITEGAASLSTWILKKIIERPRPFVANTDIINIGNESGFSFPSGHLTATIVIAVFVCYVFFKLYKVRGRIFACILMTLFVLLMMLDRMYLGAHYLTDTIAGIIVGGTWCAVALLALPPLGKLWDKVWNNAKAKIEQKHSKGKSDSGQSQEEKNEEDGEPKSGEELLEQK